MCRIEFEASRFGWCMLLAILFVAGCAAEPGGGLQRQNQPGNVTAVGTDQGILVGWTDRSDQESGYAVFRRKATGTVEAEFDELVTVEANVSSYLDTTASPGTAYRYAVAVVSQDGTGPFNEHGGAPVATESDPGLPPTDPDPGTEPSPGDPSDGEAPDDDGEPDDGEDPGEEASVILVTNASGGTGGGECTLRDALAAANSDSAQGGCPAGSGADTIVLPSEASIFLEETDNEADGENGLPSVVSKITIEGNGATIRGGSGPELRIFHVGPDGDLTLTDLTVREGAGGRGAGIYNGGGSVEARGVAFRDNRGGEAAVILNISGNVTVSGAVFEGNSNSYPISNRRAASVVNDGGTLSITDSQFAVTDDPDRFNRGGAVAAIGSSSTTTLNRVAIGRTSVIDYTAVYNEGDLAFLESTISGFGGVGIVNEGQAQLRDCTIEEVVASESRAVSNAADSTMRIESCTIANNEALGGPHDEDGFADHLEGAGIFNEGTLDVIDSQVTGNVAFNFGAGLVNHGVARIANSSFTGNTTKPSELFFGRGGAIHNSYSGELVISDSEFMGNSANFGGAISSRNVLEITGATDVGSRSSPNTASVGAGIHIGAGTALLSASASVSGNDARRDGGGVYVRGRLTLQDGATITGNRADLATSEHNPGAGGGVYVHRTGELDTEGEVSDHIYENEPDDVHHEEL